MSQDQAEARAAEAPKSTLGSASRSLRGARGDEPEPDPGEGRPVKSRRAMLLLAVGGDRRRLLLEYPDVTTMTNS